MKHPILHVRKDATVYDEDEARKEVRRLLRPSLEKLGAPRPRRSRKRRAGLSTVSLVVVAVGVLIVFRQVPHGEVPRAKMGDWNVILRATPYNDTLIVGVTFIQEPGSHDAASETRAAAVSVHVTLTGSDLSLDLADTLVRSPMTLRGDLPIVPEARRVTAKVEIGSESRTLWIAAPKKETK